MADLNEEVELDEHERVGKMFDEETGMVNLFAHIPDADKLHPQMELCGLLYIYTLLRNPDDWEMQAEHDAIILPNIDALKPLTLENVIYLIRCSIGYDEENGSLYCFT